MGLQIVEAAKSNALSLSKGILRSAGTPCMRHDHPFFVYLLRCFDGSFYVGHSEHVEERVAAHNDGRGAVWTTYRRPVTLVYRETCPTEAAAVKRERQIKRWTHAKKNALVEGNLGRLKELSKSK
jgi:predicted GIY-YIG superfamily endonuclease